MNIDNRVLLGLAAILFFAPALLSRAGVAPGQQAAFAAHPAEPGWKVSDEIATDIFERVNDERRARGLPELAWSVGLAELAVEWTTHMLINDAYGHSPDEFRDVPGLVGSGENILHGYSGASDAHVGWMESDGHRQNILGPYQVVGIGVLCVRDGTIWATQIFGAVHPPAGDAMTQHYPTEPVTRRDPGTECHRDVPLLPGFRSRVGP